MCKYADVIVDIALEKLDKTFQYKVPQHMRAALVPGMEVKVPFGAGNRLISGFVMELTDTPEFAESRLKEIAQLLPDHMGVESHFIRLAAWMRETYGATMIQCLKTVSPIRRRIRLRTKRYVCLQTDPRQTARLLEAYRKKHAAAKARLLEAFLETAGGFQGGGETSILQSEEAPRTLPYELVTKKLNVSAATLKALERDGVIHIAYERVYRNPVTAGENTAQGPALHESQQAVVDGIMEDFAGQTRAVSLIHGITGSGKTEIYIEVAARMAALGRQSIVLIPEIALTYQTVMRFYRRFGQRVSIINSRMSAGERFDQFERAKNGEIDVIIGPRSALFTPFLQLGVIIIDEEHEGTYKSETMPCYHARETAIQRAKLAGACVVLGSATPSLEAYTKALNGEYRLYTLTERRGSGTLPWVEITDLRKELAAGNRSMFGRQLLAEMEERLAKGEQTMLFLNRRGFAGFVSCRECGHVMKCPHCDVSLSYHRDERLHCHYCGYSTPMVKGCPVCGSRYIGAFRAGTQQVEEAVRKRFPQARVLRMDMDTTRKKGGHEAILEQFANGEADILIGTQMIVKGHDFKNVTLMGVLAADMSLMASDYRAAERTFQLLSQAAGRAGRSSKPGKVIIQTYQPEHYAVLAAADHDYRRFYEEEMGYRLLMGYPPAGHMLAVHISSGEECMTGELAKLLKKQIDEMAGGAECIGPAPETLAKLRDTYRQVIYLKSESEKTLIGIRKRLEQYTEQAEPFSQGSIQYDFDPV